MDNSIKFIRWKMYNIFINFNKFIYNNKSNLEIIWIFIDG